MPAFDPQRPHNDLPPLPPKADVETRPQLKACIEARAALAALDQACVLIPNPAVLINTIPLLEARASNEIENIVTTSDALFRHAESEDAADPATKEALRYRTALRRGVEALAKRPVGTVIAETVCSTIKGVDMKVRRVPGTKLTHGLTGEIVYTPPVGEALLRKQLANWERFVHEGRDIDPLIRMAVSHYQFEAIHPFTDGNGRTGRILNQLILVQQGLLSLPVLYLSRYILGRRADYYARLIGVTREGAWESWVLFMLDGVTDTARWTTAKIDAIRQLMGRTAETVKADLPKIYSRELVELTFVQPYCRIQNVVDAGLAKRQTAAEYLKAMAERGVLREVKAGREKLFVNPAFLSLLTREPRRA
ncbi:MAG: Fic family protein [Betaproteobacteria bacterium]|nr:Fic family protein [Betaproteobacteria bacterium]